VKSPGVTGPSGAVLLAVGWLLPGGGYLLLRRYRQFAFFLAIICAASVAGMLLQGANVWPPSGDLQGLDGVAVLTARAGAVTKAMAGGPYLLARAAGYSHSYLAGCLHEYGTSLLTVAGLLNLLALADAWNRRGGEKSARGAVRV
jgi:hypothetical protein